MTWPTTAPPSTSTPQPGYPIDPHQFSTNPPHMPGTTPTPVEHLFGQPSPLHPTWSSSTSFLPTASTTPPLSFASLATAPHAVPAPHLVPTTTTPLGPDTTTLHTAPPAFATPTAPTFPSTWPTAPTPSHAPTTPPTPLPGSPYPPRVLQSPPLATTTSTIPPAAPHHTPVKAAPKVRSEKKPDKLRRSAPKGFFGFTSRCTSRSSVYASTVYFSRSGNVGLYNTTTRRICPSHSSSTADDP